MNGEAELMIVPDDPPEVKKEKREAKDRFQLEQV